MDISESSKPSESSKSSLKEEIEQYGMKKYLTQEELFDSKVKYLKDYLPECISEESIRDMLNELSATINSWPNKLWNISKDLL